MRLLVLGGTKFVGRALVEEAVGRGHEVTIFHRGEAEPEGFPDVEHIHGDRHGDLGLLSGRSWDAAVDTHAYFPGEVRDAAAALGGGVAHYTLVSTLSVHPDDIPASANEESARREPLFSDDVELSGETYGALKVACEIEASRAFEGRCLTIRPGYIVGPHDPTERFIRYVRRAAGGGGMLAPGPPDAPLQMIDVRDLASFVVARIEARDDDVYGVVGPGEPTTMQSTLETIRGVAGADTSFVWAGERFLDELDDEVSRWFPMWHPSFAIHTYDGSKAVRAGLRHRPLAETVVDTIDWDRQRGAPEVPSPLSPEKERELITAWLASEAHAER
jgi:2'-hydroxyisoflavone reductase